MTEGIIFQRENDLQESSIGEIPKDWDVKELGDELIADIIAGQSPPSSTYNKENLGLPFLQGKMEFGEMFPSPTTYCSEPIRVAKKNDILLSVRAPVGDVNIAPFECCIGRGLAAIRAKTDRLNPLFLFYYLKFEGKRFEALSTGSTFKAIRMQEIEKFSIPLPSAKEQKTIVGVLGVADLAVAKAGEVIAKTERLKKGLMQTLLTQGIGHTEFKDTEIGKTPIEWKLEKIRDVCEIVTGGTPSTKHPEYFGGNIKWLKSGDIKQLYIYDTTEKITRSGIENSNAKIYPAGSVAIALSGRGQTRGRTTIIKAPMACSQSVAFMIPSSEIIAEYLHYNLSNRYMEIRNLTGHLDRSGLNLSIVSDIQIPIPSLTEQQKIVSIVMSVDNKLELERKEKDKFERLKRGLMDLLLTGKVRAKVD